MRLPSNVQNALTQYIDGLSFRNTEQRTVALQCPGEDTERSYGEKARRHESGNAIPDAVVHTVLDEGIRWEAEGVEDDGADSGDVSLKAC